VCQSLSTMTLRMTLALACWISIVGACQSAERSTAPSAQVSTDAAPAVAPSNAERAPAADGAHADDRDSSTHAVEAASREDRAASDEPTAARSDSPEGRASSEAHAKSATGSDASLARESSPADDVPRAGNAPMTSSGGDASKTNIAANSGVRVGAVSSADASSTLDAGANASEGPLRLNRGEGFPSIVVPRDEQLFYGVSINLRLLGDLTVGQVILSSGIEPYVPPLPLPGERAPVANGREVAWIHSLASGYYLGYRLVHNLDVRLLPQDWPSVYYRDTQNGTENRRSELKIGQQNGALTASYLKDGHCHGCNNPAHFVNSGFLWHKLEHCRKCKAAEHRVWKETESRTVPAGSTDLLSAVFLARTMVEDGIQELTFPVVNEQTLWTLTVRAGKHKRVTTSAGKFDCVMITLETAVPPGEPKEEKFTGLFGIRGDIRIWMEAKTGVPVVIQGDLPVPVLGKLEVNVELEKYSGTPAEFVPQR
jgi:hypothetical protein